MSIGIARTIPPSCRERLIAIHRDLVARAHEQIDATLGPKNPAIEAYRRVYEDAVARDFDIVGFDSLVDRLAASRVIYIGDYHTLRAAQRAPLDLIDALRRRGHAITLATEVVRIDRQCTLDRYLAGEIDEHDFLDGVRYELDWGFPWRHHRLPFEYCREHRIPMLGINSDPSCRYKALRLRDAMAASRIAACLERHPETTVIVLIGDLHIAKEHLPREVDACLAHRGIDAVSRTIVHQNADPVYWSLIDRGLERVAQVVRFARDEYCLMSSVPLVKAQSYLNWQHNEDELEEPDLALGSLCGPLRSEHASTTVLTEQVHVFVNAIARFLDVDASALDGFEVHSCHDLDWLDRLVVSGRIRTDELTELREQIERGESYFLASQRIIYLGSLSIDHAAEEAAHYVNLELAGHVDAPVNRVADFYIRAMREAIAYFGSKLINPKRSCFHREDIAEALERMHGRRLTPKLAVIRDVLRGTLRHLDFETERAAGRERGYPRFRALYRRPLGVHAGITHSLGYRLGDRLYDAVVAGRTTSEPIRELFHEPFTDPSRPRTCYFEWLDRLERLDPERPD